MTPPIKMTSFARVVPFGRSLASVFLSCAFVFSQSGKAQDAPSAAMTEPEPVRGWFDRADEQHSDLMPHYRQVPDSQNANPLILAFDKHLVDWGEMNQTLKKFHQGEEEWQTLFWQQALKKNSRAQGQISAIIKKPWMQQKPLLSPSDEVTGVLQSVKIIKFNRMCLTHHLKTKQIDQAMWVLEQSFLFANMNLQSDCGLIGWLVSIACYQSCLQMADSMIQDANISANQLQAIGRLLSVEPPLVSRCQEAFRWEALMWIHLVGQLHGGDTEVMEMAGVIQHENNQSLSVRRLGVQILTRLLLQPNRTIANHASVMRYYIDLAALPYWLRNDQPQPESLEAMTEPVSPLDYLSVNIMGEMLLRMATPILGEQIEKQEQLKVQLAACRTLCALRSFHEKHQKLPETLDVLVPVYLAKIPQDPYDGKPLRYSKFKRKLWSVGDDGHDEGGLKQVPKPFNIRKTVHEPTFLIRFP